MTYPVVLTAPAGPRLVFQLTRNALLVGTALATTVIAVPPDITAPIISSASAANVAENAQLAHVLVADDASTWTIVGGADQTHFEIFPSGGTSTLRWAANGTKNFESPTDTGVNNGYVVQVRATNGDLLFTNQTITFTVTDVDDTGPSLSVASATQTGSSTANLSVVTNEGNGALYWFVSTSATPPATAAILIAGTGSSKFGSQAISSTGTKTASVTALNASTLYYAYFMHRDAAGNDSTIVPATASFTTTALADVVAPTLSAPAAAAAGATGAALSVGTNEDNGTVYYWVGNTSAVPTATNIKSGTGATRVINGSQAVSAIGTQTFSGVTGLTASTAYWVWYLHRDSAGNDSAITTAVTFTTAAGADVTAPVIATGNTATVAENAVLAIGLTADESVTWSIVAGGDGASFEISGTTLRWATNGTKNFEIPNDSDTNNTYVVTVRASDLATPANTTDKAITVTVTNVLEAGPLGTLSLSATSYEEDAARTSNILGATAGSTLAVTTGAVPTGMTLNSAARTITGTPPTPGTYPFTITETLADAPSVATALSITVTAAGAPDTTAPMLSVPTDVATSSTASTLSVVTTEANGTLYWVLSTLSTPPTVAQVKAGQNHTGAAGAAVGSQAVTSIASAQTANATGLTAGTLYYTYFVHTDGAGNNSTVASADGFTTFHTEAATYFTAMTVQPDNARKALINTLIGGLKTDGLWSTFDWFLLVAAHDAQAGRLNAVNTAKVAALGNTPTFTTDRGYSDTGAGNYLDLGERIDVATVGQYTQNSGSVGAWVNSGTADGGSPFGNLGTGAQNRAYVAIPLSGNETFRANESNTAETFRASTGTVTGHRTIVRAAAAEKRGYFNGSDTSGLLTTATTSGAAVSATILRRATVYGNMRVAAYYHGSGLSAAQVANLHTRLSTYLTAIGAN